jgi:hypothetical protein
VRKKGFIILLFILISGLAVLFYFIQSGRRNISSDPYKVVPVNACFIIESSDLPELMNTFTQGNGLFRELISVNEMDRFSRKLKYLNDLLNRKECKKLFGTNTSLVSFHPDARAKLIPLLSMNFPPEIRPSYIPDFIKSLVKGKVSAKKTGKITIYRVPYNSLDQNDTVYFSIISRLLICSSSDDLIRKAIGQKDAADDIRSVPGFSKVMAASGKKEDKIYIVFKNISTVIQSLTGGKAAGLPDRIRRLAGSTEGDLYLNENGFILSGYTESTDPAEYLININHVPRVHLAHIKYYPHQPFSLKQFYSLQMPKGY